MCKPTLYINRNFITPDLKRHDGLKFVVRASDLPTMDFFCTGGRIDAYFLIEKTSGEIIYQSEYVKNDLTPVFTSAVIRTTNEDVNSESLVFKWFDWDRFGKDEYKVVFQEFCENGRNCKKKDLKL